MDSRRRARRALAAGASLLALATGGAGAIAAGPGQGMPLARGAACIALAAWAIALLRQAWAVLAAPPPIECPPGAPHDAARQARHLLALETQLEFAPVALFRVHGGQAGECVAVNARARRLLAPGRAIDADDLGATLAALAEGQRKVIDFHTERGAERALATASAMLVEGLPQRLVALMPMETELEAEAMQAWQKLVHVLTHEIMNSLTPVASLSHTARALLAGADGTLSAATLDDLDLALETISRRADSLTHFVSGYRRLASVPEARPQAFSLAALFARLSALVGPAWLARGGQASFAAEPANLELLADAGQLEQALVNLLRNAEEACAEQAAPQVQVSARLSRGGRLRIEVSDNGPGVPEHLATDIFTPFFSTKGTGSGIGLAMVRQLVHRNGGAVRHVKSVAGGARFVMIF